MGVLSCIVLLMLKCKTLMPLICTIPPPAAALKRDSRPLGKPQLHRIQVLVDANIAEALPITRLASELGMSPSHFNHRFKAALGITPHLFVLRRKMWKAAQLLAEESRSLEEVAGQVGFSNMRHFRRQFRRHIGRRPSELYPGAPAGPADDRLQRNCKGSNDLHLLAD